MTIFSLVLSQGFMSGCVSQYFIMDYVKQHSNKMMNDELPDQEGLSIIWPNIREDLLLHILSLSLL